MDKDLPVILLKKLSLLPTQEVRLELTNELSKKIIELSIQKYDGKIIIVLPNNSLEESLKVDDLPSVGVLALIENSITLPDEKTVRVMLKGLNRVKINGYTNYKYNSNILIANAKRIYFEKEETTEIIALKKKVISLLKQYIDSSTEVSNSVLSKISEYLPLDELTDIIVTFMHFPFEKKILYMNEFDEEKRCEMLIKDITLELEVISLNNKIDNDIRDSLEKEQKEFLIKAKIDKLNEELGTSSSKSSEFDDYRDKINALDVGEKTKNKLLNELKRYEYTPSNNPEISIIRSYLDTVLSLPFNKSCKEEYSEDKISKALNKTHYKMDNVKRRIIEYALLKKNNPKLENPIICLIGAPGVGKSTLAKNIASALKRDFYKISVGGLNDSSELIGHRRTYLGAAPGKIITSLIKCGSNNPVILIDEVDKMVKDYKGDPASALLDILDSSLNKDFTDNYIEEPFDLSNILFILTANDFDSVPPILRDRLEVIYVPNYTCFEKKDIAVNHLIPNILKKYGAKKLNISDDDILKVINNYTIESGVRELERKLDSIIRYMVINGIKDNVDIEQVLGKPLIIYNNKPNLVGEANILGVSSYGGALIKVSCIYVPVSYELNVTGNIGDELKDAIKVIISYLKSNNYMSMQKSTNGLHINFDNHKFKLDGSSGSLGIAMALVSLSKNSSISSNISFLGTLDLYGRVGKVTSLRDKVIAAYNSNIKTIYISSDNKNDEEDIPLNIREEMELIYVASFEEVYSNIFKN